MAVARDPRAPAPRPPAGPRACDARQRGVYTEPLPQVLDTRAAAVRGRSGRRGRRHQGKKRPAIRLRVETGVAVLFAGLLPCRDGRCARFPR